MRISKKYLLGFGLLGLTALGGFYFSGNLSLLQGRLDFSEVVRCDDGEFYAAPPHDHLIDLLTFEGAEFIAVDGDVIAVCPGDYIDRVVINDKNLSFYGLGESPSEVSLNGDGTLQTIELNNSQVSFYNMSVVNGYATEGGAAHVNSESKLHLENVIMEGHLADFTGGAIRMEDDTELSVVNSLFKNNRSRGDAGAISSRLNTKISVSGSSFAGNKGGYGGAIGLDSNSFLSVKNTEFKNNHAEAKGGVFRLADDNTVEIKQSHFSNNSTTSDGGVIYTLGHFNNILIADSEFYENRASGFGYAVHSPGENTFEIKRSVFQSNFALEGGLFSNGASDFTISDSQFIDNQGSSVLSVNGDIEVNSSEFIRNTVVYPENNLIGTESGDLYISGSIIEGNTTPSTLILSNSNLEIHDSEIIRNTKTDASPLGAIIDIYEDELVSIMDSSFISNVSLDQYGSIRSRHESAVLDIENTLFLENESLDRGYTIHINSGTVTAQNTEFTDNTDYNCYVPIVDLGGNIDSDGTCF
jgi:hypothetical protein